MSKFDISQEKNRKIWESSEKTKNDLEKSDNTEVLRELNDLSSNQLFKNPKLIYDSGYFAVAGENIIPGANVGNRSTQKSYPLPTSYVYTDNINLKIPENFLPFIKPVVEITPLPGTQLVSGQKFISTRYSLASDTIEIKGDGTTLFKGFAQKINLNSLATNALLSFFTVSELTEFSIPIANTKKVYDGTIEWNDGVDDWRAVGVVGRLITRFNVGTGCNGNTNIDEYDGKFFAEALGGSVEDPQHKISSLTSTTFSYIGNKTEFRWTLSPSCSQQSTVINDKSISGSFTGLDSYIIVIYGALYKKISGDYVPQGTNQTMIIDTTLHTINNKSFSHNGYRAYYSNKTQGILSVFETGQPDGNTFEELKLAHLPDISNGHILPYTTIKLLRNEDDPSIIEAKEFIPDSIQTFKPLLKVSEGVYNWAVSGRFFIVSPATVDDPQNRDFPVYDDTYTIVGTTYLLTSENHSFSDVTTYVPQETDVRVRIKISLQSPIYWRTNRKYVI